MVLSLLHTPAIFATEPFGFRRAYSRKICPFFASMARSFFETTYLPYPCATGMIKVLLWMEASSKKDAPVILHGTESQKNFFESFCASAPGRSPAFTRI